MRIDAHQHYWNPARGDYGWMPPGDPILSRRYGPAELAPELAASGIDGTVLVQAAPTVEETEYMLGIADATHSVLAVVGWIDFERPEEAATLRRLAAHPKLRAVRPMIQDIADDRWMLRKDIDWAFRLLAGLGLRFDLLGFPRHIGPALELLRRHPGLPVVLDHCLKPGIAGGGAEAFRRWADGMSRLAGETGAFCKLSGLVTEASPDWSEEALAPYVGHVVAAFGAERVMWGSDWPVLRLRSEYGRWREAAERLVGALPREDRARIFGGTAAAFYGI